MSSLIITHWRALSVTVGLTLMPLALRAAEAPTDPFKVQQQAAQQLPDYLYTVDGLDVTAWQDQQPVLIKVPIYDEHHVWQGDSLYFFKAGQLTGVQMPYGRYEFNGKGRMIVWMNEQGQAEELPGSPAWGQRQGWLLRRARQQQRAERRLRQAQGVEPAGKGSYCRTGGRAHSQQLLAVHE